ncbi:MAG TPA: TIGR01458 family HAD-type hydrolase, partial [Chloroflexi bacterium]|nr:TIGR01458 family HAD-type hydrolase [Chloroflexota bacterium]
AFRQLHSGAGLIGLGLSRYWQAPDGLRLDAGAFVKALEFASGKSATIVGKPSPTFFQTGIEQLGLDPAEIAMVGDDVVSDIGAGQLVGLVGVLVRTGKFRPGDLQRGVVPDAVVDSIADIPALLG